MLERRLFKEYTPDGAAKELAQWSDKLKSGKVKDQAADKLLDGLYVIFSYALKAEKTAILLDTAELLKLAYGQGLGRSNEEEYWKAAIFSALDKKNFQVLEYLLEGGKLLYKGLAGKRGKIIGLFKMIGTLSMEQGKFFIGARIIGFLVTWLPKEQGPEGLADRIIDCTKSIGDGALRGGDQDFFREICVLVGRHFEVMDSAQEELWDKVLVSWLELAAQKGTAQSIGDWGRFFTLYHAKRTILANGFYVKLLAAAGRYNGQTDADDGVSAVLAKILAAAYMKEDEEALPDILSALDTGFKTAVLKVGWQRAREIFTPWLIACFHMLTRRKSADGRKSARGELLQKSLCMLAHIIQFAAVKEKENATNIFADWRDSWLQKCKTDRARKRAKALFLLLAAKRQIFYPM